MAKNFPQRDPLLWIFLKEFEQQILRIFAYITPEPSVKDQRVFYRRFEYRFDII